MDPQLRARAEARLEEAARGAGIADPRPAYRERLRQLRQASPEAFDRAIRHYEQNVLPAMARDDALLAWVEYGRFLASIDGRGRVVSIDPQGRATDPPGQALNPPGQALAPPAGAPPGLIMFIPDDPASDVMVLCRPVSPSDAQEATVRLLVERKLG